jgi:leukotriene-A4 hydrolase
MKLFLGFLSLILASYFFCSCEEEVKSNVSYPIVKESERMDNHSYANFHEIYTKHLDLELDVNFSNNSIYGIARHEMVNSGVDTVIFDVKNLEIQKVTTGRGDEKATDFVVGQYDSILGSPLMVTISKKDTYVNIYYKTTEKSEAIDWLRPEQTSGKKLPFMYTQGQAILTRSWIPLQDSPALRITYAADVKVPKPFLPVMSANNPVRKNALSLYHFEMKQAIPSYLIALAVGDLEYHALSDTAGVYAEKELIDDAAYEFEDLPKMIAAAEKLYGKYQWEKYDVIVLPYSFPFGGMENPRLTFANPTLIAGDRSLVSVIAHELAHSWSGNLVTNASWDDFWLNEGFTVYFENRIMEELYGKEVADILVNVEFQELQKTLTYEAEEDTKLKLNLKDRNPDDGMTDIAYIKGASFLRTLESKVGRPKMDAFLNSYFKEFAFKTITTEDFVTYLNTKLLKPNKVKFNTDEWIYKSGIPKNCVVTTSDRLAKIEALADNFVEGKNIFKKPIIKREEFTTQEWQTFIRRLPTPMDPKKMKLLDKKLDFKGCGNAEIMAEWYVLAVNSSYTEVRPNMERFLKKVGRRKYLEPIYQTLAASPNTYDLIWARAIFNRYKTNYHFISRNTVEEIIYN